MEFLYKGKIFQVLFAFALMFLFYGVKSHAQYLDDTWSVSVKSSESVKVNIDGSFRVSNIPVKDEFGHAGPGSNPDSLSDSFYRAIAMKDKGAAGDYKYAFSEPFQIIKSSTYFVQDLTFTNVPPPFPVELIIEVEKQTLTAIEETSQLTVTAKMTDGSLIDVTAGSKNTIYRTNAIDIAEVGPDGLVTANGPGVAYISVEYDKVIGVASITVSPDDELTTIQGFVQLVDETPVKGATVILKETGIFAVTDRDGSFQFLNAPTRLGNLTLNASAVVRKTEHFGSTQLLSFAPGGVTDAGVIHLKPGIWQIATYEGYEYFTLSNNNAEWGPGCKALCEELFPLSHGFRIDTCETDAAFFSGNCVQGAVPNVFDPDGNFVNYGKRVCRKLSDSCSTSNSWQNNVWTCSCLGSQ